MTLPKESAFPKSNIDFLRLLLATLVIITHSYPLSGLPEADLLHQLTGGQIVFSYVAVRGFFVLSGFLIFKSLMASEGLGDYFWKRALRIFPGYWMVILLTVFVVGPLVTDIGTQAYFTQSSTWAYLKGSLTMQQIFAIDHVLKDVPYTGGINGSLWTIPYEVLMYGMIAPLFFIRRHKTIILAVVGFAFAALTYLYCFPVAAIDATVVPVWGFRGVYLVDLPMYFLAGTLLALPGRKSWLTHWGLFAVASGILILTGWLGGMRFVMPFAFPFWIIAFAHMSFPVINNVRVMGDFSYGIYLYGFLIQQVLMHYFHFELVGLAFWSICGSIVCGALSWHLLEKHALRLKNWKWWKLSRRQT